MNLLNNKVVRRVTGLAGVAAVAAGTVLAGSAPAQASERVYFENNKIRNMCLDDSNSHHLRMTRCSGNAWQTWIETRNGGYITLRNSKTGRCLDHSNSHHMRTVRCNGGRYQQWLGDRWEPDLLKNRQTGKCVDYSRSHGLRATGCRNVTNNAYQQWWSYVPS